MMALRLLIVISEKITGSVLCHEMDLERRIKERAPDAKPKREKSRRKWHYVTPILASISTVVHTGSRRLTDRYNRYQSKVASRSVLPSPNLG
jgi:hypothetical protein